MFGLEDDKKKENVFEFDLEKDLKKDVKKKKEIQQEVETKISKLKTLLREGSSDMEKFEQLGILLRGYAALQKVISRTAA